MQQLPRILLIGPMGSGKSTLGEALAARLGLDFIDVDARIVGAAGMAIPAIFETEGEAGFRKRETDALLAALREAPAVIATGGGVVLAEANRDAIREAGLVVYLHIHPDEQLRRVAGDSNRPLLDPTDPAGQLARLQAQREPLYRELADLTVDSSAQTSEQLAAALALRLTQMRDIPGKDAQP